METEEYVLVSQYYFMSFRLHYSFLHSASTLCMLPNIYYVFCSVQLVFQGHHKEGCREAAAGTSEQTRRLSNQRKWNIKRYGYHGSSEIPTYIQQHSPLWTRGVVTLCVLDLNDHESPVTLFFFFMIFPQGVTRCPSEMWTPREQTQWNITRSGCWIMAAATSLLKSPFGILAAWLNTITVSTVQPKVCFHTKTLYLWNIILYGKIKD